MNLLNVIIGYNRFYLLKNCVESFFEFGPEGDLLIIDDGSDDQRIINYLKEVEQKRNVKVMFIPRGPERGHGGLYDNMNLASEYAILNDYSHIFFIQDDQQFMWKDADFEDKIESIFKHRPNAAMIQPLFQKALTFESLKRNLERDYAVNCWKVKNYGICDVGVMQVSLIKEKKFKFLQDEGENARKWLELGYNLYSIFTPTLTFVPWVESFLGDKKVGKERKPVNKYYLKPLGKNQQLKLISVGLSEFPFCEDYCFPWGWKCLSPYWFTRGRYEYIKLLIKRILQDKRWMPKFVKSL